MPGYHLYSDNYKTAIFKGFSTLQHEEEFVDLTLAAEGHLVKVHKNIIALASPYIKALLQSAPCLSPVIFLNNVRKIILQYIIEYIYQGEVNVPEELIEEFVEVGKSLHISGIDGIPKKTSLLFPNTNVSEKPVTVKSVAAHIKINNINNKNSLEVLQGQKIENHVLSATSNTLKVNVNQIGERNGTHIDFPNNNFDDTGNNIETGQYLGTGNDIRTGNDIGTDKTVNNMETGNFMGTINYFEANNDIETGNYTLTGITIENDKSLRIGNDMDTTESVESCINTGTTTEPHLQIDIQKNVSNENDNLSSNPGFEYKIQIQHLDSNNMPGEPFTDVNTELDKIDVNELRGLAQYSITERGASQLILNRFMYCCQFESRRGHRRRWRCIDYRRSHCTAFVETEDGLIFKRKGVHTHSFHDKKIYEKHKKGLIFNSIDSVANYVKNNMEK